MAFAPLWDALDDEMGSDSDAPLPLADSALAIADAAEPLPLMNSEDIFSDPTLAACLGEAGGAGVGELDALSWRKHLHSLFGTDSEEEAPLQEFRIRIEYKHETKT